MYCFKIKDKMNIQALTTGLMGHSSIIKVLCIVLLCRLLLFLHPPREKHPENDGSHSFNGVPHSG